MGKISKKVFQFIDSKYVIISALLLISLPAVLPTIRPGFFGLHDEAQHLVDIYQMYRAFEIQGFPPRWVPDFNFGLGYPYFNFYYHLPFYISTLFLYLGFSMTQAFKMVILVSLVSGVLGFYFFAQRHISKLASLIAASLYLYTPYFAVDAYVRGALGELALLGLIPWTAFGINRLITQPGAVSFVFTSLCIGLLGISHNVLNLFVFPLLFGYGLFLILQKKELFKKRFILLICAFVLGVLLSAYYWLPPIFEMRFISKYEQIKIEDQFPFLKQLLVPSWGYGSSHWGPDDEMSFQIGILNLLAVILAIALLKFMKLEIRKYTLFFLSMFLICFILMNYRTLPFWNLHQFLRYVQFPWRLLIFTTFSTAALAGFAAETLLSKIDRTRKLIYSFIVIAFILLFNIWYFRPSGYKEVSDERYLQMYFANRTLQGNGERGSLSKDYLGFSEDFLPPTIWQKRRPTDLPIELVESEKESQVSYTKTGITYQIDIDSPMHNKLFVYSTYFPGWVAFVDGEKKEVSPATDLGIISLDVPAGAQRIIVKFENTPIRTLANTLSLCAAVILAFVLIVKPILRRTKND